MLYALSISGLLFIGFTAISMSVRAIIEQNNNEEKESTVKKE